MKSEFKVGDEVWVYVRSYRAAVKKIVVAHTGDVVTLMYPDVYKQANLKYAIVSSDGRMSNIIIPGKSGSGVTSRHLPNEVVRTKRELYKRHPELKSNTAKPSIAPIRASEKVIIRIHS